MIRTIGIVLGGYAVVAFALFVIRFVQYLEDGAVAGTAFWDALGAGAIWPASVIAYFWA